MPELSLDEVFTCHAVFEIAWLNTEGSLDLERFPKLCHLWHQWLGWCRQFRAVRNRIAVGHSYLYWNVLA
jgi:hypothetical protein